MNKLEIVNLIQEAVGNSLAASIYGLAKSSNGFFKSEQQAAFLKGQLDRLDGAFSSGNIYGNSYRDVAEYDDKGITRIKRKAFTTNKETTFWERKTEGVATQADEKAIRYYKREIQKLEQSIANRQADRAEFESSGMMGLYNAREKSDSDKLNAFKESLRKVSNS